MAEDETRREDEAEEEGAEDLSELQPKRLSGKKIIAIAGGALVLVAALAVGAMLFLGEDGNGKNTAAENGQDSEVKSELIFVDVPELVVNLNTGERQQRFLRARISLEVESKQARAEVEEKLPRVIDDFQVYLRELRVQDLNGSAGLYRLKEELLKRINRSVEPVEVKDVLFREMVVQ